MRGKKVKGNWTPLCRLGKIKQLLFRIQMWWFHFCKLTQIETKSSWSHSSAFMFLSLPNKSRWIEEEMQFNITWSWKHNILLQILFIISPKAHYKNKSLHWFLIQNLCTQLAKPSRTLWKWICHSHLCYHLIALLMSAICPPLPCFTDVLK